MNLQQTLIDYVMMFAKCYNFTPSMAPFTHMILGHEWFIRKFYAPSKDQEAESLVIWEAFLTPKLLLTRLGQLRNQFTLLSYQPNLVSRQFGLIQIMPKPLFARKNSLISILTKTSSAIPDGRVMYLLANLISGFYIVFIS